MKSPLFIKKYLRNYKVTRYRPKIWILPWSNIAYAKITKVASSSIEQALSLHIYQQLAHENVANVEKKLIKEYSNQYSIHSRLKDLKGEQRPKFIFSFVRNPMDRLYSSYVNKIRDAKSSGAEKSIFWNHHMTLDMSFEDFIFRLLEIPDAKIDRHLRSQSSIICEDGTILVDFVGRFENLRKDWKVIADEYDLPELAHANKSSKTLSRSPYSYETATLVADRFSQDINTFGYGKEVQQLMDSLKLSS
jgi:hypothetical protein